MSEDIDYAARVQRGIALLDQKWPAWATEINLDTLDIQTSENCVTAQYDGAMRRVEGADPKGRWYEQGMHRLGIEDDETYADHGFNGDHTYDDDGDFAGITPGAFEALNGLWKAAILERRSQVQDAPAEPEATA